MKLNLESAMSMVHGAKKFLRERILKGKEIAVEYTNGSGEKITDIVEPVMLQFGEGGYKAQWVMLAYSTSRSKSVYIPLYSLTVKETANG